MAHTGQASASVAGRCLGRAFAGQYKKGPTCFAQEALMEALEEAAQLRAKLQEAKGSQVQPGFFC